jgi:ABC-type nickel/cobalt efflux system permease component RcnA
MALRKKLVLILMILILAGAMAMAMRPVLSQQKKFDFDDSGDHSHELGDHYRDDHDDEWEEHHRDHDHHHHGDDDWDDSYRSHNRNPYDFWGKSEVAKNEKHNPKSDENQNHATSGSKQP